MYQSFITKSNLLLTMAQRTSVGRPNILITGGAGFIGSNLCEYLLEKNNVICVDNFSSGKESNIDHLLSNPHFEFIRHDVTEPLDFSQSAANERFQVEHVGIHHIYHAACSSSPTVYTQQPIQSLTSSAIGTKNVLDVAVKYRSKVMFFSDARVYGLLPGERFSPSEEFFGPFDFTDSAHAYVEGKRYAENLVQTYASLYSLEVKIVRLSSVYGPKMHLDDGRIIPEFIRRALQGADISFPKELSIGSFLYVTDALDALEKLMTSDSKGVFNIGHGSPYKISDVAKKIIQHAASQSKIVEYVPLSTDTTPYHEWVEGSIVLNIVKVKDALGWFPIVLLDEGLQKTLYYMKSLRGKKGIVR